MDARKKLLIPELKGLIIRYDHDDLLILLRRIKARNITVINFDRHHDCSKRDNCDIGSWAYHGKKEGIIKNYIWIPPVESMPDVIRRAVGLQRLKKVKEPLVLSVCYDYFMGHKMRNDRDKMKKIIDEMIGFIRGKSILFAYAARSQEWTDSEWLNNGEELIKLAFASLDMNISRYSQPFLRKKVYPYETIARLSEGIFQVFKQILENK
jgi:hypothetical protein